MQIIINGTRHSFEAPVTLDAALEQQGYAGMTVAVARNGAFVPKQQHADIALEDGDALEIVAPMQGG